jgi:hypothetical protein
LSYLGLAWLGLACLVFVFVLDCRDGKEQVEDVQSIGDIIQEEKKAS